MSKKYTRNKNNAHDVGLCKFHLPSPFPCIAEYLKMYRQSYMSMGLALKDYMQGWN